MILQSAFDLLIYSV